MFVTAMLVTVMFGNGGCIFFAVKAVKNVKDGGSQETAIEAESPEEAQNSDEEETR
jgi:hypothetical protein